ncbi:FK506-binding protein 2 precursor [Beauveria brongniartii RCEF 3172]|uniref:FK506-binding protein 2 n=1 Tax=Beauveria brongniartii RCEF 3172 TaxID=1081107 RepID=A0A162JNE7_9HYPO|nr:FK506-binding protein 2 precursor [Beauveria brongniartii RCEF 3172]
MASTIGECVDILNLIGDHVNNKKLLYDLCLVSRHFNYIFSKRLWRRLEFDDLNTHCFTDDERRGIILQSPSLEHTRILICGVCGSAGLYQYGVNRVFQEWVAELAELVQKLPNLESIVACELDVPDDIMLALSNATSLKSLVFHFTREIQEFLLMRDNPDLDIMQALGHGRPCCILPPFENLTRLSLLEIFGELSYWLEWVLDLLCRSPSLEYLSLSIGFGTEVAILDQMSGPDASIPCHTFFSDLCNKYGNQSSKQLKLRTLRLKEPLRCPNLPTLSKSTDTTYLEDIYVDTSSSKVIPALDVLSPNATPSLRHLTIEHINHTAVEVLRELSSMTDRRLSIQFLQYKTSEISRLYPDLVAESAESITFWDWPSSSGELCPPGNNCVKSIGVDICFTDFISRSDREIDMRRHLLGLFEKLGSMRSLEELWLEACSYSKIKSHASVTPEEAYDLQFVLSNLAAACRRLHYVKIGKLTWRIHPKVRHTKQQVCTFEEIDAWEAAAEGPAALLGPNPLDHDVLHKDWW